MFFPLLSFCFCYLFYLFLYWNHTWWCPGLSHGNALGSICDAKVLVRDRHRQVFYLLYYLISTFYIFHLSALVTEIKNMHRVYSWLCLGSSVAGFSMKDTPCIIPPAIFSIIISVILFQ